MNASAKYELSKNSDQRFYAHAEYKIVPIRKMGIDADSISLHF